MNPIQITLAVATVEEAIAAYRALEAAGIIGRVSIPSLPSQGAPVAAQSEYKALCAEFRAKHGRRFMAQRVGITLTPIQQLRVALGMEAGEAEESQQAEAGGLPEGEESIPPDDGGDTF